jgi:hypothetical protein
MLGREPWPVYHFRIACFPFCGFFEGAEIRRKMILQTCKKRRFHSEMAVLKWDAGLGLEPAQYSLGMRAKCISP